MARNSFIRSQITCILSVDTSSTLEHSPQIHAYVVCPDKRNAMNDCFSSGEKEPVSIGPISVLLQNRQPETYYTVVAHSLFVSFPLNFYIPIIIFIMPSFH